MIPELDKLRNKKLSFGCKIRWEDSDIIETYLGEEEGLVYYLFHNNIHRYPMYKSNFDKQFTAIGHPITWGRIEHIFRHTLSMDKQEIDYKKALVINELRSLFNKETELYDQNELQRMQNKEARENLKELLIQFTNYIGSDE